jgi:hypothetical protein
MYLSTHWKNVQVIPMGIVAVEICLLRKLRPPDRLTHESDTIGMFMHPTPTPPLQTVMTKGMS